MTLRAFISYIFTFRFQANKYKIPCSYYNKIVVVVFDVRRITLNDGQRGRFKRCKVEMIV